MDLESATFAIIVIAIIYWVFKRTNPNRITKYVDKLPGPVYLPIMGTSLEIFLTPRKEFFTKGEHLIGRFGKLSRSWIGNRPMVNITSAEYVEPILSSSVQITKSFTYDFVRPWLNDGLLTSTGEKWHRHRKLITPTFHFKILDHFMQVFIEKSKLLVTQLESQANGQIFDIYPYITHCALDMICETAMGVQTNAMFDKNNEYVNSIYKLTEIVVQRVLRPWLHPDFIFYNTTRGKQYNKYITNLHNFTSEVIEKRKKALSANKNDLNNKNEEDILVGKKTRLAFLDLLIEASQGGTVLNDLQIREEVDTFMFEGHDTTTAGICWSLFLLGNHLDIQDQVYQEIESIFQGEDRNLTINDLGEFKLLERCIKEALRLYPSVPSISRRLTQDIKIGDYLIPTGCTVNVHIFLIQRDEKHFPEPRRFNPDRFLPENQRNRHPYAFIPFSAGPRNCIGQKFAMYEEKTVLAYILRKFKVKAIESEETVQPVTELILRPFNGLRLILEPRT